MPVSSCEPQDAGLGPAEAGSLMGTTVRASDGTTFRLFTERQPLPRAPVVLCVPAMGVPAGCYKSTLAAFARASLNAAVFDLRGNGESSVRADRTVDFGYDEIISIDLPRAIDAAAKLFPGSPLFVLGHSLGGQLACLHASTDGARIAGLVLIASGSVHFANWTFPGNLLVVLGTMAARLISQTVGYFPGRQLGFGGREARRLIRDWSNQALSGCYAVSRNPVDFEAALASMEKPVLAITIAGDRLAPPAATRHLCGKMPRSRLDYRTIGTGGGRRPHFDWMRRPHHMVGLVAGWIGKATSACSVGNSGETLERPGAEIAESSDPTSYVAPPVSPRAREAVAALQGPATVRAPARRRSRPAMATLAALLLAGGGTWYGHYWWTVGRYLVSTDDAYVAASTTTLAAKVSGYVVTVPVENNAEVHAGQVLATVDDGDYRLASDTARDKVATQEAAIERIGWQATAQQSAVDQARAQLASATAEAVRADQELARQQQLASRDFASQQKLEQARAVRDQAIAGVQNARAAVAAALSGVAVLKAQQQEATRTLKELKTALAKAERDLSFAVIRAPYDGVVGNRAVQPGDYVQPGQRLASLVPLDAVHVDANFKETQLARLRVGQPVALAVDALPDRAIDGTVESIAPASGSVFSLLPADNATGNFTKVVQRVTVRIRVPAEIAAERLLRPGMSVVVSVNTRGNAAPAAAVAARTVASR